MPSVNFVGELENVSTDSSCSVSVTWGMLPGSRAWTLTNGESSGESQVSQPLINGMASINHPIDVGYETTSAEGWPLLVCEVWDKTIPSAKNFLGCGSVWLPMTPGSHAVDVNLWKPTSSNGLDILSEALLPTTPDLKALRELVVNPYLRSKLQTTSTGDIRVKVHVVVSNFKEFGVSF
jgi:hypothetical protein